MVIEYAFNYVQKAKLNRSNVILKERYSLKSAKHSS